MDRCRATTLGVCGLLILTFFETSRLEGQVTFSVNSTDDAADGACDVTHCSLREAITAANAQAGADIIAFNITGATPHTIQPGSALPTITDPVTIDGTTDPDFADLPVIQLDGSTAGGVPGLLIAGGMTTVRGVIINGFSHGIHLQGAGDNVIVGNLIGTNAGGTGIVGNSSDGVFLENTARNTIGGTTASDQNVIAGNGAQGVTIFGDASTGNRILGNLIGTDVTGTVGLGNSGVGVRLDASGNTVGGTMAGAGNVISGNGLHGILVVFFANDNVIQGNLIGTDVTGTAAIGNGGDGVIITVAGNTTVGGATTGSDTGARNVISGNAGNGISFHDLGDPNFVQG